MSTSSVATSDNATLDFSKLVPFSNSSDFHPYCFISDYNNQTNVEQCWLGDQYLPLADLDTENPSIVSTMNNWIQGLVKSYGVDGLRIDTAKHVRKDFWPAFAKAAGVFTMGEVMIGDVGYAAPYTGEFQAILCKLRPCANYERNDRGIGQCPRLPELLHRHNRIQLHNRELFRTN